VLLGESSSVGLPGGLLCQVFHPFEDGDGGTALFERNVGVASLQLSQIITNRYLTDFDVCEDDGTPLKSFGWREHLNEYEGCRS
jgi:hypothetical protein